MLVARILLFALFTIIAFVNVNAQFGIKRDAIPKDTNADSILGKPEFSDELSSMLAEDPELLQAMQIFAQMSPEEMMETMEELKTMLGDDPDTLAEMELLMKEISEMSPEQIQESLDEILTLQQSMLEDTLEMLANADESSWDKILENKDQILDVVVQTGAMSDEEAALYKSDPAAWEEELKVIWEELRKQANEYEQSNSGNGGEL